METRRQFILKLNEKLYFSDQFTSRVTDRPHHASKFKTLEEAHKMRMEYGGSVYLVETSFTKLTNKYVTGAGTRSVMMPEVGNKNGEI